MANKVEVVQIAVGTYGTLYATDGTLYALGENGQVWVRVDNVNFDDDQRGVYRMEWRNAGGKKLSDTIPTCTRETKWP